MVYIELVRAFAKKLGDGVKLEPDESGAVMLDVDGMSLTIMGLEDVGLVVLSGVIGVPPPEERKERLYEAVLKANYNFSGTAGATMSINPDTDELTLCKALPLNLVDGETFFAETESFLNVLESWRKIVSNFRGHVDEPSLTDGKEAAVPVGLDGLGGGFGSGFMQV